LRRDDFELGVYVVAAAEMTYLNETFLGHQGSTDVITFNYADGVPPAGHQATERLHGEIFICLDEAQLQARRFRTVWQSELVRYLVHGVLHLCGYNDQRPASRREMKRVEDRTLRQLGQTFDFRKLSANPNSLSDRKTRSVRLD
jgi:probable rRNA maturation factor